MSDWTLLRHFKPGEFRYPDQMHFPFVQWLDRVREVAGVPMVITNDYRASGEAPSGSAGEKSFHRRGRAVDIRSRNFTAQEKWRLLFAIVALADQCPGVVELEAVHSPTDKHWHIAADDRPGAVHRFIEADD